MSCAYFNGELQLVTDDVKLLFWSLLSK